MNFIKENISLVNKERIKSFLELTKILPNIIYDGYRYIRYSATFLNYSNREKMRAILTKNFHVIEKGLSFKNPKKGYGKKVVLKVVFLLEEYVSRFGYDETAGHAVNTLIAYEEFNSRYQIDTSFMSVQLGRLIDAQTSGSLTGGGILQLNKQQILTEGKKGFAELVNCRHSIRQFSNVPVDDDLIKASFDIAHKTPSVCNRQTTKVYVYKSQDMKEKLLSLQNGNRGFGHEASHIAVVTADLRYFNGVCERNQPYFDGGLMAMTFVYALHSMGIGTCFLNWSVNHKTDRKLRKLVELPNECIVTTLIAIGNLPDTFCVAESPKRKSSEQFFIENEIF